VSVQALAMTGLVVAAGAAVWLFSPMRLQAEMGVFFLGLAILVPLFARQARQMNLTRNAE
jgi:hypothetical protein